MVILRKMGADFPFYGKMGFHFTRKMEWYKIWELMLFQIDNEREIEELMYILIP